MEKELFCLLCICHFIGDYFLQTSYISMNKEKSHYYTYIHSLIYSISFLILLILSGFQSEMVLILTFSIFTHCLIDNLKCVVMRKYVSKLKSPNFLKIVLYFIDQVLHILTLYFYSHSFVDIGQLQLLFFMDGIYLSTLTSVLFFVSIFQPAYVTYLIVKDKANQIYDTFNKNGLPLKAELILIGLVCWFQNIYLLILLCFMFVYRYSQSKSLHSLKQEFDLCVLVGMHYIVLYFIFLI